MSSGTLPNYIMFYKCEIKINGISYDATDDVINWEDIETAVKRSSLGGAVRSFTSKFDFCGVTRGAIVDAFLSRGVDNDIAVTIFTQNNSWLWNPLFEAKADMSTIIVGSDRVSFSCMDDTIDSVLKAKKGIKYEYLVSGMATERMQFERIMMNNSIELVLATQQEEWMNYGQNTPTLMSVLNIESGWMTLPLYWLRSSIPVSAKLEFVDQKQTRYEHTDRSYASTNSISTLKPVSDFICRATANVRFLVRMHISYAGLLSPLISEASTRFTLGLYVFDSNGRYVSTVKQETYTGGGIGDNPTIDLTVNQEVSLLSGQRLVAMSSHPYYISAGIEYVNSIKLAFSSNNRYMFSDVEGIGSYTFRADWEAIGKPVEFNAVRPVTLLQSLLDSICGGGKAVAVIDGGDDRVNRCLLAPGESIREYSDARVYSSFGDFCDFMETLFGFVYHVVGDEVRFVHRDTLFTDDTVDIGDVKDVEISVDSGMLYSSVVIGQEKVEYGEDNGIYEANFMQSFSTGRNFGNNELRMDTGYRVDAFGVEYLVEMRADRSKDNQADNDIFAIYCDESESMPKPDTSVRVMRGADQIEGYFNTAYHPRRCIDANQSYLASFADELTYAGSEGNVTVEIDGLNAVCDVSLSDYRRYTPYVLKFSSSMSSDAGFMNGMVRVSDGGRDYYGWISQYGVSDIRRKESKYSLILNSGCIG